MKKFLFWLIKVLLRKETTRKRIVKCNFYSLEFKYRIFLLKKISYDLKNTTKKTRWYLDYVLIDNTLFLNLSNIIIRFYYMNKKILSKHSDFTSDSVIVYYICLLDLVIISNCTPGSQFPLAWVAATVM